MKVKIVLTTHIGGIMEQNGYSLYNKIVDFQNYVEKNIDNNISAVHRNLKIHFQDECYNLSKNMLYATYNKGNIRIKYLVELQVNISLLDMLLNKFKEMKEIKATKVNSAISKLGDIKNIIYGWKFNEEKSK